MPYDADPPDLNDPLMAHIAAQYPTLKIKDGKTARHALAAKNARTLLKQAFPNVVFSVKSETYAGGSNITARWDLWPEAPTDAQVATVIDRFSPIVGSRQDDSNEYDQSPENKAFRALFGEVKFAMTSSYKKTPQEIAAREAEQLAVVASLPTKAKVAKPRL